MRKILSVLLVSLLIFSFAACGSEKNISQGSGEESTETSAQESSGKDDFSYEEDISDVLQTLGSEDGGKDQSASNILIVYFSRRGNTDYPDEVGGDLRLIETVTPYTADFDELRDVNRDEMGRNYLPELKESNLDIAGYEAVFVGYPIWWASIPMPIASFLEEYDFTGKAIIPFCSHGGGRFGQSLTAISKLAPDAVMGEALSVHYSGGSSLPDDVEGWLRTNGMIE